MVKSKKKEIEGEEGDGGKVRIGGKMENSAGTVVGRNQRWGLGKPNTHLSGSSILPAGAP